MGTKKRCFYATFTPDGTQDYHELHIFPSKEARDEKTIGQLFSLGSCAEWSEIYAKDARRMLADYEFNGVYIHDEKACNVPAWAQDLEVWAPIGELPSRPIA